MVFYFVNGNFIETHDSYIISVISQHLFLSNLLKKLGLCRCLYNCFSHFITVSHCVRIAIFCQFPVFWPYSMLEICKLGHY
jgi:hypothetical protein